MKIGEEIAKKIDDINTHAFNDDNVAKMAGLMARLQVINMDMACFIIELNRNKEVA